MHRRNGRFPVLFAAVLACGLFLVSSCVAPAPPAAPSEEAAPSQEAPASEALPDEAAQASDGRYCYGGDPFVIADDCGGIEPPEFDPAVREAACTPFVIPDPEQAVSNVEEGGEKFTWSFLVNFEEVYEGVPLACLRLYFLVGDELEPLDDGGILVDACGTTTTLPEISGGVADFGPDEEAPDDERDVSCWLSLSEWLHEPALQEYMQSVAPEAADEFLAYLDSDEWTETPVYNNFAMLAEAWWDGEDVCNVDPGCPQTIGSIDPVDVGDEENVYQLLLTQSDTQAFSLGGPDSGCGVIEPLQNNGDPAYLWRTVSPSPDVEGTTEQNFDYRQNPDLTSGDESHSTCVAASGQGPFVFSLAERQFTIGRSPHSNHMKGKVKAAELNASDSKPPR